MPDLEASADGAKLMRNRAHVVPLCTRAALRAGMARDLAPDVEALADGAILKRHSISGAVAGHVRKKALHAAARLVARAPELAPQLRSLPAKAIEDGNHAVVLASAPPLLVGVAACTFAVPVGC